MLSVLRKIPVTIKAVGVVSLLLNASTLMVYSVFGLYLYDVLGINLEKIGFLDGAVEAFSFVIKIFSGILSDFIMNRKILIAVGAFFLFIAKPLEATAVTYCGMFSAKVLERLGNGIQATPRDAIVGDWSPKQLKGTSFGFRQAFAAIGSVIGAILAYILLKFSNENFQFVFWMASIPSLMAILTIIFFVKDKKHKNPINAELYYNKIVRKISIKDIKSLDRKYWTAIFISSTYMFSKVTESLVILHIVKKLGLPMHYGAICMICYQLGNSFISLPAGVISDKLKSRDNVLIAGMVVFLMSDMIFIFCESVALMIIGLVLLGSYIGISQSILQAKIMDTVPVDLKGTGIGIFNCACAISCIVGGTLSGYLADTYSTTASFVSSSILALLSLIVIAISSKRG